MLDFRAIPSSANILMCNATETEEIVEYKSRQAQVQARYLSGYDNNLKQIPVDQNNPEIHLKAMLPTFTPIADVDSTPKK